MLLRDWFAGQALGAIIDVCRYDTLVTQMGPEAYYAMKAYEMADAIMVARLSEKPAQVSEAEQPTESKPDYDELLETFGRAYAEYQDYACSTSGDTLEAAAGALKRWLK
jgi:uncharacterized membrane protein YfbV (UPF0208 family)